MVTPGPPSAPNQAYSNANGTMNGHGNNRGVGYSTSVDTTQTAMADMTLQQNSVGQQIFGQNFSC